MQRNPHWRIWLGRYPNTLASEADAIVALGGDGFMLRVMHDYKDANKPIYGMNRGSVGFMMNAYTPDDLPARLSRAEPVTLRPLYDRHDRVRRNRRSHCDQ